MSTQSRKYELAICELFNPYFHGFDYNSDPSVRSHFLIFELIDLESFYNNEYTESCEFLQNIYLNIVRNLTANSVASNTNNDFLRILHFSKTNTIFLRTSICFN